MTQQVVTVGGATATMSLGKMLNAQAKATHSYGTGHVDWTLSKAENDAGLLSLTGTADAAVALIATPTDGKLFIVVNACGQAATIKASGETGVAVATGKTAIVRGNGTDFVRVTADA